MNNWKSRNDKKRDKCFFCEERPIQINWVEGSKAGLLVCDKHRAKASEYLKKAENEVR